MSIYKYACGLITKLKVKRAYSKIRSFSVFYKTGGDFTRSVKSLIVGDINPPFFVVLVKPQISFLSSKMNNPPPIASDNTNIPLKKMKLEPPADSVTKLESVSTTVETLREDMLRQDVRTVGTMCGSWRPEEEYGGHVFVLKLRDGGMSPDPTSECHFPENIEDVWVEQLLKNADDIQFMDLKVNRIKRGVDEFGRDFAGLVGE